ncbi:MAG: hypothetical protein ACLFUB_05840 [Cyclobacteriaceae bacterium]
MGEELAEEMYSYKAHDSLMTFTGQLIHIRGASMMMAAMFLQDVKTEGPAPQHAQD